MMPGEKSCLAHMMHSAGKGIFSQMRIVKAQIDMGFLCISIYSKCPKILYIKVSGKLSYANSALS